MRTRNTMRLVLLLSLAFVHNVLNTMAQACDLKKCEALLPFSFGEGGQRPDEATNALASGQYVLSLVSEGVVLQTEQIIIAK